MILKNTAKKLNVDLVVAADGSDDVTSTPTVEVSLDNGDYATITATPVQLLDAADDPTNVWGFELTTAEMNADLVSVRATATGCLTRTITMYTESVFTPTVANHINADIDSRMATFTYTAPANSDITAIKAKTDNLPASPAAVGSAMTLASGQLNGIATASNVTDATTTITTAITNKAVTPATDLTALTADVVAIKEVTDQLTFTEANKVDATATATVDSTAMAAALDESELLASIDETLTAVNTRVAPGSVLSVRSAIDNAGTITTKRGDDYVQGDLSIVYTATDLSDIDSIALNILSANGTVLSTHTPVVADAGTSTQTIHFVLTDTETTAIPAGTVLLYEVVIVDGTVSKTIIEGSWISRD